MPGTDNGANAWVAAQTIGLGSQVPILGAIVAAWLQKRPCQTPSAEDGSSVRPDQLRADWDEMGRRVTSLEAALESMRQDLSSQALPTPAKAEEPGKIDAATQPVGEGGGI